MEKTTCVECSYFNGSRCVLEDVAASTEDVACDYLVRPLEQQLELIRLKSVIADLEREVEVLKHVMGTL